ncbi:glycoside hydrolase family 99-like domain-containing protein [Paenibacillus oralis]|uniref:glycoside hydrolase family 99-like domain-containing protein n=1 Tax=Paenibacillus oralis TaxID=2490856 RepID=UPI0015A7662D|nr:glycoside hydrolase family 99-like domain-containing protein [Paenibacillus oralis]
MKELEVFDLIGLIRQDNNKWESTTNDPQIYFKGAFKKGWYRLECEGSSEDLRFLKLYIDYGNGFNEDNSVVIGKLDHNNSNTKPIEFKHDVSSLRLDPGDSHGVFSLKCNIKRISALQIWIQAFLSFRQLNKDTNSVLITKVIKKWRQNGFKWLWNKAITLMANRPEYQVRGYEPYKHIEESNVRNYDYSYIPLYSIIIPIFKINEDYLEKCLSSILNQSYQNFELFILGRGNINEYQSLKFNNSKSTFVHTDKDNIYEMLLEISEKINGDYTIILQQEDFIANNTLHYITLKAKEKADLIFTNEDRYMDNAGFFAPFSKEEYLVNGKINSKIVGEFIAIDTMLFREVLTFDNNKNYSGFLMQCLGTAKNIQHIPKFLYHRRAIESMWPKSNSKMDIISFYLPQFHAIPENDEWWGKGFTEWTNVKKATSLFSGHYQPHIPGELGYYNLVEDKDIQDKQIRLAKSYGVSGFCYYYYWFDGKRLLEKPLNAFLENKNLDFPFCICWANESWTRRWDGQEKEVLMKQVHNQDSDRRFIEDVIPVLKDERYIRINNDSPLLLIYRAELFPDLKATVEFWKRKCWEEGIPNLHVCMVQSFGQIDPTIYGCDSAVEFPPHGIYANEISKTIPDLVPDFSGNIYDYREVVDRSLQKRNSGDYNWFRGTMLSWDNTARRKSSANVFNFASPIEYEKWLVGLVDYTRRFNEKEHQLIFVNAWNEWAEGTHLEPDQRHGYQYLEATKRATLVR